MTLGIVKVHTHKSIPKGKASREMCLGARGQNFCHARPIACLELFGFLSSQSIKGLYYVEYQRFCPVSESGPPNPYPASEGVFPLGPKWGGVTLPCGGGIQFIRLDRNSGTLRYVTKCLMGQAC